MNQAMVANGKTKVFTTSPRLVSAPSLHHQLLYQGVIATW